MIKKLLGSSASVTSAAVLVGFFSMVSRVVGLVRDRMLAGTFGSGDELDIYVSAFRIPDLLVQLLVLGALSASFIPLFSSYFGKDDNKAWKFTNNTLNVIGVAFAIVSLAAVLGADIILPLVAGGYGPEKFAATVEMTRVIFLGQMFFAVSMVFGSVLQGARRFLLYSLAPILYNLGIIAGALWLYPQMGLIGLAWGTVLGAAMHASVQTIGVLLLGYRWRPVFNLRDKDLWTTLRQMPPRVLGLAVSQGNYLVMSSLATYLAAGSATNLQFAYNLNFFPIGIIGVSYAVAVFPTLCDHINEENSDGFRLSLSSTVRQVLFFMIPATILFLLLRAQIVRVAFGAGEFDWDATIKTADTLGFFALSFFAQALVFVVVRAFFALRDSTTPFIAGLVGFVFTVVFSLLLMEPMGVAGFALAYSLASIVQFALLWTLLRVKFGSLDELRILKSLAILSVAGFACAIATQLVKYEIVKHISLDTFVNVLGQGFIAGFAGLFAFVLVAIALRSPEMLDVIRGLKRKFLKTAKPPETVQVQ